MPGAVVKSGGVWKNWQSVSVKSAGLWVPGQAVYAKKEGVWGQVWPTGPKAWQYVGTLPAAHNTSAHFTYVNGQIVSWANNASNNGSVVSLSANGGATWTASAPAVFAPTVTTPINLNLLVSSGTALYLADVPFPFTQQRYFSSVNGTNWSLVTPAPPGPGQSLTTGVLNGVRRYWYSPNSGSARHSTDFSTWTTTNATSGRSVYAVGNTALASSTDIVSSNGVNFQSSGAGFLNMAAFELNGTFYRQTFASQTTRVWASSSVSGPWTQRGPTHSGSWNLEPLGNEITIRGGGLYKISRDEGFTWTNFTAPAGYMDVISDQFPGYQGPVLGACTINNTLQIWAYK